MRKLLLDALCERLRVLEAPVSQKVEVSGAANNRLNEVAVAFKVTLPPRLVGEHLELAKGWCLQVIEQRSQGSARSSGAQPLQIRSDNRVSRARWVCVRGRTGVEMCGQVGEVR